MFTFEIKLIILQYVLTRLSPVTVDCTKALAPAELRAISVAARIRLQFRNVFTCSDLATGSLLRAQKS